jgi:hypothetical protein
MKLQLSIFKLAVILTTVYIIFCVATYFALPECIAINGSTESSEADCGSEGHDNSILSWTTSFFIGILVTVMAALLFRSPSCRPVTSGLAFSFLGLAFLIQGVIGLSFPNSGIDDGHGQIGYYLLVFLSYSFWTVSTVFLLCLCQVARDSTLQRLVPCRRSEWVLFGLVVLMFILLSIACMWNSLALWNSSDSVMDEHAQETTANYFPIWLLGVAKLLWHIFYCCFIVVLLYVWKTISDESGIEGFPCSTVFLIVWICQIGIGTIVVLSVLHHMAQYHQLEKVFANPTSTAILNFFMLMTTFLLYEFILAVFPFLGTREKINETDSDTDEEANPIPLQRDSELPLVVDGEGSTESFEEGNQKEVREEELQEITINETAPKESTEIWVSFARGFQDVAFSLGFSTRTVDQGDAGDNQSVDGHAHKEDREGGSASGLSSTDQQIVVERHCMPVTSEDECTEASVPTNGTEE